MSIFRRFTKSTRHNSGARFEVGAAGNNFGVGAPYHQAWEFRPLPGAGAAQWAWETLALPMYTPIGAGTRNRRQFLGSGSNPTYVAVQGITLAPLGGTPVGGDLTGQFVTQPLYDLQQAEMSGIVMPTAYQPGVNPFEMPNYTAAT